MLDLDTLKIGTHPVPVLGKNFQDCVFTKVEAINDGTVLFFSNRSNTKFYLSHLSSEDKSVEYIRDPFNNSRVVPECIFLTIEPIYREETWLEGSKAGTWMKLIEAKKGLCCAEVEQGGKFIIETIAWKGEKMPKAMEAWGEWLEKSD